MVWCWWGSGGLGGLGRQGSCALRVRLGHAWPRADRRAAGRARRARRGRGGRGPGTHLDQDPLDVVELVRERVLGRRPRAGGAGCGHAGAGAGRPRRCRSGRRRLSRGRGVRGRCCGGAAGGAGQAKAGGRGGCGPPSRTGICPRGQLALRAAARRVVPAKALYARVPHFSPGAVVPRLRRAARAKARGRRISGACAGRGARTRA